MLSTIFDEFYKINKELNKLFYGGKEERYYRHWPEVNIYENQDQYMVVAKIPGVKKEDISITIKDNALKIAGERKTESAENVTYYLRERKHGKFERNFLLNDKIDTDKIEAELKNGLLLIKLPKRPEAKPVSIAIK